MKGTARLRRISGLGLAMMILLVCGLAGCDTILPKRTPGQKLYSKHCSECHGVDGGGQTIRSMGETYSDLLDDAWRYAGDAPGMRTVPSETWHGSG